MKFPVQVSVDLRLTSGVEQIQVAGSGDRATVRFPSLRSGFRHILGFFERPELVDRLMGLHGALTALGLSLYIQSGPLVFPVIGRRARKGTVAAMVLMGRLATRYRARSSIRPH